MKGQMKQEIPEKTRRLAASSGTIPTCENPGVTRPGIEPGSSWWESSRRPTITGIESEQSHRSYENRWRDQSASAHSSHHHCATDAPLLGSPRPSMQTATPMTCIQHSMQENILLASHETTLVKWLSQLYVPKKQLMGTAEIKPLLSTAQLIKPGADESVFIARTRHAHSDRLSHLLAKHWMTWSHAHELSTAVWMHHGHSLHAMIAMTMSLSARPQRASRFHLSLGRRWRPSRVWRAKCPAYGLKTELDRENASSPMNVKGTVRSVVPGKGPALGILACPLLTNLAPTQTAVNMEPDERFPPVDITFENLEENVTSSTNAPVSDAPATDQVPRAEIPKVATRKQEAANSNNCQSDFERILAAKRQRLIENCLMKLINASIPVPNPPTQQPDEDKAFFESMLPAVKTLNLDNKLEFRKHQNLHNIKITGEAASSNTGAAAAFVPELQKIIKGGYTAKQVFNVDETGQF
ncbi:hypothetical protein PR048_023591 [Dryococelus australis]|uniref:BESS domain-containing protein n=1 Tax=Dryococelus australis TaxID=614101 RepID=A0ABQ9GUK1_9NEOP|nr:hypothetical protein PR048_023591 [Dryococelus australis]